MAAMTTKDAISPYSIAVPPVSHRAIRFRNLVNGTGTPPDTVLMQVRCGTSGLKKRLLRLPEMQRIPTWIAVVAVALGRPDGRWLMHRRPYGKLHAGLWEFPGGKVEQDEVPDFALEREIREELGIELHRNSLEPVGFARSTGDEGPSAIVILLYRSTLWTGEPVALEGGEIGWFTPDEIAQLAKPPLDVALASDFFGQPGNQSG